MTFNLKPAAAAAASEDGDVWSHGQIRRQDACSTHHLRDLSSRHFITRSISAAAAGRRVIIIIIIIIPTTPGLMSCTSEQQFKTMK